MCVYHAPWGIVKNTHVNPPQTALERRLRRVEPSAVALRYRPDSTFDPIWKSLPESLGGAPRDRRTIAPSVQDNDRMRYTARWPALYLTDTPAPSPVFSPFAGLRMRSPEAPHTTPCTTFSIFSRSPTPPRLDVAHDF